MEYSNVNKPFFIHYVFSPKGKKEKLKYPGKRLKQNMFVTLCGVTGSSIIELHSMMVA